MRTVSILALERRAERLHTAARCTHTSLRSIALMHWHVGVQSCESSLIFLYFYCIFEQPTPSQREITVSLNISTNLQGQGDKSGYTVVLSVTTYADLMDKPWLKVMLGNWRQFNFNAKASCIMRKYKLVFLTSFIFKESETQAVLAVPYTVLICQ
jgi:hypothetical protein